jgi:hypothetical protein
MVDGRRGFKKVVEKSLSLSTKPFNPVWGGAKLAVLFLFFQLFFCVDPACSGLSLHIMPGQRGVLVCEYEV